MAIKGKVALITGAGEGIGKGVALHFAELGAKLFLCDINEDTLNEVKKEVEGLGAEVGVLQYDAYKSEDIKKVVDAAIEKYGTVDILINNTGVTGPTKPIVDLTLEEWDHTLETNLRGPLHFIHLLAPYMIKQHFGKIVNIASQSGKLALAKRSPYCASKMGIIGMTRTAAEELGPDGINVNCICPGSIWGARSIRLVRQYPGMENATEEECKAAFSHTPVPRPVYPLDIATTAAFLCDDELSGAITGQDINVNCGYTSV